MKVPSIVSAEWLKENIDNPALLVLDARQAVKSNPALSGKIIPGSVPFKFQDFNKADSNLPNTLCYEEQFQSAVRKLGFTEQQVVVYDDLGVYFSPRVWFLFHVFGYEQVSVLDGGLPAWIAAGYDMVNQHKQPEEGRYEAEMNLGFAVDKYAVHRNVKNKDFLLIDVRSADRFQSKVPEPRAGLRSGIIPGSVNLPYTSFLDEGKYRSTEAIKDLLDDINPTDEAMAFSCGSGITACIAMLGASVATDTPVAVYDGSWTEWGGLRFE